ncbi:Uncharacterised protein [Sphingobacterium multivorum]|uniref:Uncharacterized protein n=1 Tax=Sphingobacterium multivorum TaxID=28454 RepID=A0A2X2JHA9_SPHMU|nr:Uncharacterised protein [Sphingobacterium multivorum]
MTLRAFFIFIRSAFKNDLTKVSLFMVFLKNLKDNKSVCYVLSEFDFNGLG